MAQITFPKIEIEPADLERLEGIVKRFEAAVGSLDYQNIDWRMSEELMENDKEINKLRSALEFYANPANWRARERAGQPPIWSLAEEDRGARARNALDGDA